MDSCDEVNDLVLHQPSDAICSDGNACTGAEHCDTTLGCVNGQGLVADDGNPCTVDGCDPLTGISHQTQPEGTACGTGAVCDAGGSCRTGVAFSSFASLAAFQLNGSSASINAAPVVFEGSTMLRLTNNGSQGGSAILTAPTQLVSGGTARSFSSHFVYQMSNPRGTADDDRVGADGITFAIVTSPTALGAGGFGIGYAGLSPSVVVELDT